MQTNYTVAPHVQHATGKPGTHSQAAKGSTQQAAHTEDHPGGDGAIAAMTLLGLIGIGGAVLFVLVCAALVRYIAGRKRVAQPGITKPPYRGSATVLTFTATAIQGTSGHDSYKMAAEINVDYEKHLAACSQCRDYIVTDLHEFAEQLDHLILDGSLKGVTRH